MTASTAASPTGSPATASAAGRSASASAAEHKIAHFLTGFLLPVFLHCFFLPVIKTADAIASAVFDAQKSPRTQVRGLFVCELERVLLDAHEELHDVHFELLEVLLLDAGSLELIVKVLDLVQQQLKDALGVDEVTIAVLIGLRTHGLDVKTDAFEVAAVAVVVFVQDLDLVEGVAQVVDAEGLVRS